MISDKIILVDIDGVVLDWATPFEEFLTKTKGLAKIPSTSSYDIENNFYDITRDEAEGLYKEFNNNHAHSLPYTHGSLKWMTKINQELGFRFHAVTKMGRNIFCMHNRLTNLKGMGDIWEDVDFFENHECKSEVLNSPPYKDSGCFWVEDLMSNAILGLNCGLSPILMSNPWNVGQSHDDVPRVDSWCDIYHMLNTST